MRARDVPFINAPWMLDGCPFGHGSYEWIDGRPICPVCVRQAKETMERYLGMTDSEQNEMDALRMELARIKIELERAKVMYNDLARESVAPDMLKRYCDNARAYGWECREQHFLGTDIPAVVTSTVNNPFVNPDWDAHLRNIDHEFLLSAKDVPL